MELTEHIRHAWGWIGIEPIEVVSENDFGNLMVLDSQGRYWRLCPEELSCEVIAEDALAFEALKQDVEFQQDWYMSSLVVQAKRKLGPLEPGRKYCLKIPGVLGGKYQVDNFASISLVELVGSSGSLALQIKDLPDGTQIRLNTK